MFQNSDGTNTILVAGQLLDYKFNVPDVDAFTIQKPVDHGLASDLKYQS